MRVHETNITREMLNLHNYLNQISPSKLRHRLKFDRDRSYSGLNTSSIIGYAAFRKFDWTFSR